MRVKAVTTQLPQKYIDYAFTQDDSGQADITVDKQYEVYGTQENTLGKFLFVLTDTINAKLPWWMPSDLYEVVEPSVPTSWKRVETQTESGIVNEIAPAAYFGNETAIEDGTKEGYAAFEEMKQSMN